MEDVRRYSVLMSVYGKEKAEHLRASMESIRTQTVPPDDFVLVCDGPLGEDLEHVIHQMQETFGNTLRVILLKENGGLGNALNVGMRYCKNELIARMDSDDISYPDRCERQLAVFRDRPETAIVSGTVEEFSTDPSQIDTCRVLPETQDEILKFVKKRNPFNHPCVMYRKSAVLAAGGYQDFYLLEDYYLWIRMLYAGYQGYNLQEPLLWMRAGSHMYQRRSGWKYARSQIELFRYMRSIGMIGYYDFLKASLMRMVVSMVPNGVRKNLFENILRKKGRD
ncbi:MAG: glycosyltransferase [Blautia sp.]|nr:glycosyltransferase [Blautia sp.]